MKNILSAVFILRRYLDKLLVFITVPKISGVVFLNEIGYRFAVLPDPDSASYRLIASFLRRCLQPVGFDDLQGQRVRPAFIFKHKRNDDRFAVFKDLAVNQLLNLVEVHTLPGVGKGKPFFPAPFGFFLEVGR